MGFDAPSAAKPCRGHSAPIRPGCRARQGTRDSEPGMICGDVVGRLLFRHRHEPAEPLWCAFGNKREILISRAISAIARTRAQAISDIFATTCRSAKAQAHLRVSTRLIRRDPPAHLPRWWRGAFGAMCDSRHPRHMEGFVELTRLFAVSGWRKSRASSESADPVRSWRSSRPPPIHTITMSSTRVPRKMGR